MKEVKAEGTEYIYFTKADGLPTATEMGLLIEGLDPFMREHLPTSSDIRLVLIKSFFRPGIAHVYYLHWDDGSDLIALDIKAERSTYEDDDFKNSVKTLHQKTFCANCGHSWHTLVIPPGDPYLGAPGLLEAKIKAKVESGAVFRLCPNCGARLRQLVVKIF